MDEQQRSSRLGRARWRLLGLVAAAVVLLDLIAGEIVESQLVSLGSVELIGSLLRLELGRNSGGAFGLFQGWSLAFAASSVLVVAFLLFLHARSSHRRLEAAAYGAVIGGAIGNLIDRLVDGAVLDYLDLGVGTLRLPLFNLADLAISVGLSLLLLSVVRERRTVDR